MKTKKILHRSAEQVKYPGLSVFDTTVFCGQYRETGNIG